MTCHTVRDYVGIEAIVRLYSDAKGVVVEFQCASARARLPFMALYAEIAAALAEEGVVAAPAAPVRKITRARSAKLCVDVTAATLAPLRAMVESSCSSARREGLSVLASLCATASPSAAAALREDGTLSLLHRTAKAVDADFEARANCLAAISSLQALSAC